MRHFILTFLIASDYHAAGRQKVDKRKKELKCARRVSNIARVHLFYLSSASLNSIFRNTHEPFSGCRVTHVRRCRNTTHYDDRNMTTQNTNIMRATKR